MPLIVHVAASSRIFCRLCVIMHRRRIWTREQFVEEGFRDPLVVVEGGLACLVRLVALSFPFGCNGGAELGKCGFDYGRRVVEDVAGVADGDKYKFNANPILSEGATDKVVLVVILGEFLVAFKVLAKANFEEDEGEAFAV